MKHILAFGDSLTWGFQAGTWMRHAFEDRWPNVLAAGLGGKARVIEEGQNGRMTVHDDPYVFENRSGAEALPILLSTHQPLDLMIIMLGTNDLKWEGRQRALDARLGMARLVEIIRTYVYKPGCGVPEILLMSPPHLGKTEDEDFAGYFEHAIAESKNLARQYAKLAGETECHFFDAASIAKADPTDGVHLDAANTRSIGTALIPVVKRILDL
ncbi:SGNH/GDSL hydrolase family protein [Taklimakanibacter lacteus]|uniref:SGNH/GDSL hydrolase family protein n=1 Tax=Taklimakanibacter lacteus TaxID=2268456 RepID=UPI000E66F8E1